MVRPRTVNLAQSVKDNLTEAMMPRLALEGQERLSQERERGRACAKAGRLEKMWCIQGTPSSLHC